MGSLMKKSDSLAPSSIDTNLRAGSLDQARFKRDSLLLDLQVSFSRQRDKIQNDYLSEVGEIIEEDK